MSGNVPKQGRFRKIYENIQEKENSDTLVVFYAEKVEFARFHNGLVWQISSVWVPIALAGLTLDYRSEGEEFDIVRLRFVAYGSMGLLILWTCLAEWHRWVWRNHRHVSKLIEFKWKLEDSEDLPSPPTCRPQLWRQFMAAWRHDSSHTGIQGHFDDLGIYLRWTIFALAEAIWIIRLIFGEVYCK